MAILAAPTAGAGVLVGARVLVRVLVRARVSKIS